MAELHLDRGERKEADADFWESHRICERLDEDANKRDLDRKEHLAQSWANLGGYYARLDALETALHFYRLAEGLRQELYVRQAENKEYALAWVSLLNRVAEL